MSAIVALTGVLRTEQGDPIPEGLKLFRTLAAEYRVIFSTEGTLQEAEHWLKSNMVFGHAEVLGDETAFVGTDISEYHLKQSLSRGRVELFVSADADRCKAALENGVPCLLFGSPKFVRTMRSSRATWQDIQDEVDRQRSAQAELVAKTVGSRWE